MFPGGYFGFDAARRNWIDLTDADMRAIQRRLLSEVLPLFPRVVFRLWLVWTRRQAVRMARANRWQSSSHSGPKTSSATIRISQTAASSLAGSQQAALSVVSSAEAAPRTMVRTMRMSPALYLNEPVRQLADCRLMIDLAHSRVSGTVTAASAPPRLSHQRQLERFAPHGAGLLVHHHGGLMTGGRAANKHQSGWVIYRGGPLD